MQSKRDFSKTDASEYEIPFGIHKGTKLKDLPDSYLLFLSEGNPYGKIKEYIDENIDAIIANVNKNRHYNKVDKNDYVEVSHNAKSSFVHRLSDEDMAKIVK